MNLSDHPLWCEKYRPMKVADTILPDNLKNIFQSFVNNKSIPNLILSGTSGVGKTTIARAMLEELGCDYMIINGSLEGRLIDTLRVQLQEYASSISIMGGRKYIIIDESDHLGPAVQPALRNMMEDLSDNCGFILTCNYKNKIIDPLKSRCSVIDFKIEKEDKPKIASQIMKRLIYILDQEQVKYDKETLVGLIKKHMPDWRRIINEIQVYSSFNSEINSGIMSSSSGSIDKVFEYLKDKDFTSLRKWIGENADQSSDNLFSELYNIGMEKITKESIPNWISIIAENQYRLAFVSNPEITLSSMMLQLMVNCTLK